jgi:hypothetical protein
MAIDRQSSVIYAARALEVKETFLADVRALHDAPGLRAAHRELVELVGSSEETFELFRHNLTVLQATVLHVLHILGGDEATTTYTEGDLDDELVASATLVGMVTSLYEYAWDTGFYDHHPAEGEDPAPFTEAVIAELQKRKPELTVSDILG